MNPLEKLAACILHRIDSSYFGREKEELLEHVSAEYQKYIAAGYDGEAAVEEIVKTYGTIDKLCKAFVKKYAYHPLAEFWMVTVHGSIVIGIFYLFTALLVGVLEFQSRFPAPGQIYDFLHLYAAAGGMLFYIPYTPGAILYGKNFNGSDHSLAKTILALLFTLICEKTFLFAFSWPGVNLLPFPIFLKETSISTVPWFVQSYYCLTVLGCFLLGFLSCRLSKRRR